MQRDAFNARHASMETMPTVNTEPSSPADPISRRQLAWRCRRGMLELDLLLQGFLDAGGYEALDEAGRHAFGELLGCPDAVLLEYLLARMTPADPALARVVHAIRCAAHP